MADMKTLWHDDGKQGWHQVTLNAIDAAHALEVDPEHWALAPPAADDDIVKLVEDDAAELNTDLGFSLSGDVVTEEIKE